jgi:hypothetical protein
MPFGGTSASNRTAVTQYPFAGRSASVGGDARAAGPRPKPRTNSLPSVPALGAQMVAAVCLLFALAVALMRIFNR